VPVSPVPASSGGPSSLSSASDTPTTIGINVSLTSRFAVADSLAGEGVVFGLPRGGALRVEIDGERGGLGGELFGGCAGRGTQCRPRGGLGRVGGRVVEQLVDEKGRGDSVVECVAVGHVGGKHSGLVPCVCLGFGFNRSTDGTEVCAEVTAVNQPFAHGFGVVGLQFAHDGGEPGVAGRGERLGGLLSPCPDQGIGFALRQSHVWMQGYQG